MWKIPTNNDLAKFVYDYEGKILHQKRYQATIGDYNRSTHTQLLLDGTYRNGIDKNHGKTLCFTKAIDGFVIEFHVYCWEFIKTQTHGTACKVLKGKIVIKLSSLKALEMKTELNNRKKFFISVGITYAVLISVILLLTVFKRFLPLNKDPIVNMAMTIILIIMIILGLIGVRVIKDYIDVYKIFQTWVDHDLINYEY